MDVFRKIILRTCLLILIIQAILSCTKEDPPELYPVVVPGQGVFIVNEGNFQWGNARMDYYNKTNGKLYSDIYFAANNEPLGDVFQSMRMIDGQAWLIVNNSGKIEVVDPITGKRIRQITGLMSPRYVEAWGLSRTYVTDLYAGAVSIINRQSGEIMGSIKVNGWTEGIASFGNFLAVAAPTSGMVYLIDPEYAVLTDSLYTGMGPVHLETDREGRLWILCGGSPYYKSGAKLVNILPGTFEIAEEYQLPGENQYFSRMSYCPLSNTVYLLGQHIYRFRIGNREAERIVEAQGRLFYGMRADPSTGLLYVSDAVNYTQAGMVEVYDSLGEQIKKFRSGRIPGDFCFF